MSSLKNFRVNFKGLNNIYKFTDESIVKLVESEILVEKKNWEYIRIDILFLLSFY